MRVSVIIPTYNSAPLVVEAVESVLAQTYPDAEIIVVDDGSTDDTADQLAQYGERIRYIRQENGGVSSARNRGIRNATGDFIAFLDADDVWHPDKLRYQVALFTAQPQWGLIGTEIYPWPSRTHPSVPNRDYAAEPTGVKLEQLMIRNSLVTSTIMVRTETIRAAGDFNTSLQGPEDYEMWLRICRQVPVAILPCPLTGYRSATPNSLSKNAARMENGLHAIINELELTGLFRYRPLLRRRVWAYFRYTSGLTYRDSGKLLLAADRLVRSLIICPLRLHADGAGALERSLALMATVWKLVSRPKCAVRQQ